MPQGRVLRPFTPHYEQRSASGEGSETTYSSLRTAECFRGVNKGNRLIPIRSCVPFPFLNHKTVMVLVPGNVSKEEVYRLHAL